MGGKGLTITTKPAWKQHGAFRFPGETGSKTDVCVNEMPIKPFEFLDHTSPVRPFHKDDGWAPVMMHYHEINVLGTG